MTDMITRTPDDALDAEYVESWMRSTDEPELRDIFAGFDGEWWQVIVPVAEFLRDEPLESLLDEGMTAALTDIPGTDVVAHEDREVWVVSGDVSGEALVGAAADFVDEIAARVRAYLDEAG
ncbi:MAG: hypothetical protein ACOH1T_05300 [Microbacteriaceae bacterium]